MTMLHDGIAQPRRPPPLASSPLEELVARIGDEGLHLHYAEAVDTWRTLRGRDGTHGTPRTLCGTPHCFRLKLRNLQAEGEGQP